MNYEIVKKIGTNLPVYFQLSYDNFKFVEVTTLMDLIDVCHKIRCYKSVLTIPYKNLSSLAKRFCLEIDIDHGYNWAKHYPIYSIYIVEFEPYSRVKYWSFDSFKRDFINWIADEKILVDEYEFNRVVEKYRKHPNDLLDLEAKLRCTHPHFTKWEENGNGGGIYAYEVCYICLRCGWDFSFYCGTSSANNVSQLRQPEFEAKLVPGCKFNGIDKYDINQIRSCCRHRFEKEVYEKAGEHGETYVDYVCSICGQKK